MNSSANLKGDDTNRIPNLNVSTNSGVFLGLKGCEALLGH